jgi:alanyl-tRNA synthetase
VGILEIISEEGVSAGVRRIVALTGDKAQQHVSQTRTALQAAAERLGVGVLEVPEAARELMQTVRDLKKQLTSGAKPSEAAAKAKPTAIPAGEPEYARIKAALRDAARTLNVSPFDVPDRVAGLLAEVDEVRKQLSQLTKSGDVSAAALLDKAETIGTTKVLVAEIPGANPNLLRQLIDQLRKKADSTAILFMAATGEDKVLLVAGLSRDLVQRGLSAGNWVRDVAPIVGGGGGGKPDMAQAGGKHPEKLPEAIQMAWTTIRGWLAA